MRISAAIELPADVESAYAVLTDQSFQDAKCAATSDGVYTVAIRPAAAGLAAGSVVEAHRELPTDGLPDALKSLVGATLTVVEQVTWGPADSTGVRRGTVALRIEGVPLTLTGTAVLTPTASGCHEAFEGDLKAKIPFFGSKVEQAAYEPIRFAIDTEMTMLRERLAG